ncbi:MAG: acyl-CoA dehydrogenase family protein [Thermocrispum sp.]
MRWELSDEQAMLRETLRSWLSDRAGPSEMRKLLDAGDVTPFEDALDTAGWSGVGIAEEYGGEGGGLLELAVLAEEFGRAVAPDSAWLSAALIPGVAPGERACLAVAADHVIGGDLRSDGETVTGQVVAAAGADRARTFIVPAGGRLYAVDAPDPGVNVQPRRLLDRSRSAADVTFSAAQARQLEVDAGEALAAAALRSAVLVAADALGAMERLLELSVEYSKQRRQFGVPIGSFQAVKHAAADMLVKVEAARSIVYFAAAAVDQGHPDAAVHAAVAKAQVTAAAAQAADTALTVHGAIGYTWEHDLHLLYKRAKLDERLFGSPHAWNERIAAALPLVTTP